MGCQVSKGGLKQQGQYYAEKNQINEKQIQFQNQDKFNKNHQNTDCQNRREENNLIKDTDKDNQMQQNFQKIINAYQSHLKKCSEQQKQLNHFDNDNTDLTNNNFSSDFVVLQRNINSEPDSNSFINQNKNNQYRQSFNNLRNQQIKQQQKQNINFLQAQQNINNQSQFQQNTSNNINNQNYNGFRDSEFEIEYNLDFNSDRHSCNKKPQNKQQKHKNNNDNNANNLHENYQNNIFSEFQDYQKIQQQQQHTQRQSLNQKGNSNVQNEISISMKKYSSQGRSFIKEKENIPKSQKNSVNQDKIKDLIQDQQIDVQQEIQQSYQCSKSTKILESPKSDLKIQKPVKFNSNLQSSKESQKAPIYFHLSQKIHNNNVFRGKNKNFTIIQA